MTARDLAAIAFRTLAVWLFASGVGGLFGGLVTWSHNVVAYGNAIASSQLASASIFIPVGALLWMASESLSRMAFPGADGAGAIQVGRGDLYAFASVLVGMFLLSDAITQVVYWIVVWRSARGTGFWEATEGSTMPNTVVYWVHVRAQVGEVVAKAVVGAALLLGPERLKGAIRWLRRELSGSLAEEDATSLDGVGPGDAPRSR